MLVAADHPLTVSTQHNTITHDKLHTTV